MSYGRNVICISDRWSRENGKMGAATVFCCTVKMMAAEIFRNEEIVDF
jgi:hypothetical protein